MTAALPEATPSPRVALLASGLRLGGSFGVASQSSERGQRGVVSGDQISAAARSWTRVPRT